jgi:hypothetical protein
MRKINKIGIAFLFLLFLIPSVFAVDPNSNGGGDVVLAVVIVLPMVLGLFFLIGAATMSEDHNVLKIFLFMLSIPSFFASMWLGLISVVEMYNSIGFGALQEAIGTTTFWVASVYFVLIAYFIFYGVFKTREWFNKKKEDKSSLEY